jgi:hypothetical protein
MLTRLMPHSSTIAYNPVFKYAVRGVRWGYSAAHLKRYTLIVVGLIAFVSLSLWGLIVANAWSNTQCLYSPPTNCSWMIYDSASFYIGLLTFVSIAGDVILDFACVIAALASFGTELSSARWDLLRLTPIREDVVVDARHALTQVRAWRTMVFVVGLRIGTTLVIVSQLFLLPVLLDERYSLWDSIQNTPILSILMITGFALFALVYLVEPYWRMIGMTALGMALCARFRNVINASLAAMFAIFVVWILQVIIMAIMLGALTSVFIPVYMFFPIIGSAIGGAVIYGFYTLLRSSSLRRAVWYSFMRDSQ